MEGGGEKTKKIENIWPKSHQMGNPIAERLGTAAVSEGCRGGRTEVYEIRTYQDSRETRGKRPLLTDEEWSRSGENRLIVRSGDGWAHLDDVDRGVQKRSFSKQTPLPRKHRLPVGHLMTGAPVELPHRTGPQD